MEVSRCDLKFGSSTFRSAADASNAVAGMKMILGPDAPHSMVDFFNGNK
jgi:hypothetical protein